MIQIRQLKKTYSSDGSQYQALKGIDIDFPDTGFISVLGPSGCGKTTLLNLIGGLDSVSEGDILVDGISLAKMNESQKDSYRNDYIGFIFQNYYLIPQLSVLDNVEIALSIRDISSSEAKEKSIQALKEVGMEEFLHKKPNQLSGGQEQRVAIARALVTGPKIILADEPTGALDSDNSIAVMKLLKQASKVKLVIMVTHNEALAEKYSDGIILMQDGKIKKAPEFATKEREAAKLKKRKSLSLSMKLKLACKALFSKKWKSILTSTANSFGMIGIAFFLALNHGFNRYSAEISASTASSLPVVVSAFDLKTESHSFQEDNASEEYPDTQEIYPSVSVELHYSFRYNKFSTDYMNFIQSLQEKNILQSYVESYNNDYGFNLCTSFPASLEEGKGEAGLGEVKTSSLSYNRYASRTGLPYNIFHVLYGDMNQYDLIDGRLPESENDLVLVVDKYNAVRFPILKALGFYNSKDTEDEVKDSSRETKVKPISFSDVIGKEYRIFKNDDFYSLDESKKQNDDLGIETEIKTYKKNKLTEEFYQEKGIPLHIVGIIRPKASSPLSLLTPSLCYSPDLQKKLMTENETSEISKTISDNLVFKTDESHTFMDFLNSINKIIKDYQDSKASVFPTSDFMNVCREYFWYYPVISNGYMYKGFHNFLIDSRKCGANLISEDLLGKDLSDHDTLNAVIQKMQQDYALHDRTIYADIISLVAYMNAYANMQCLILFPTNLSTRSQLLKALDSYNDGQENEEDKVTYEDDDSNYMIEDVGQMISLASLILLIFAAVSLIVSSFMTGLIVSNNVMERRKEIGLLRSLGSKKSDVTMLFELESFFTGFLSGVIGSLITYICSFPLNSMLNKNFPEYRIGAICDFTWYHALLVVAISVVIGLIAAFVPSYRAGKQNPVEALRSD